jgi:RNA-directed DNA polymerase
MRNPAFVTLLARSFLGGEQTVEQIVARCKPVSGEHWSWLPSLAQKYIERFVGKTRPRQADVVAFLHRHREVWKASQKYGRQLPLTQWLAEPQRMQPVTAARAWKLPAIESVGGLSDWLGVSVGDLEWFADLKGLLRLSADRQLNHYNYRMLVKDSGSIRLIESPKLRLKDLQRQILTQILDNVPPHPSVHGFVKGRSIKSCVGPHVGQRVILRMDLQDFFPSFPARRIQTMFRTLGYPESVADLLGGICTNFAPASIFGKEKFNPPLSLQTRQWCRDLYCRPHLPQGAPTSPSLANICSYRLDCRLAGLAKAPGAKYTRYADDLAFSGGKDFENGAERFSIHVATILMEEGFHVNHRKTRIMRQGVRQHLVGVVTNQHPNVIRADFDRLKAILTNCVRFGPESQNREAHAHFRQHLEGKVSFVESINPLKGQRVRSLLNKINWPQELTS